MGKIDTLSNEIKKYTKSYNDILVGMHTDITKYKNEVKSQALQTKYALEIIESNLKEVKSLRLESDLNLIEIQKSYQYISEADKRVKDGLIKFESDKEILRKNLSEIKEEISEIIVSNDLKFKTISENVEATKKELTNEMCSNFDQLKTALNIVNKRNTLKFNFILFTIVIMAVGIGYLYYKML